MTSIIKENNQISGIKRLTSLMQGHKSQQSAPLVSSIAILVCYAIRTKQSQVDQVLNEVLSDIILWKVQVVTGKDSWPTRQFYSTVQLFADPEDRVKALPAVRWNSFFQMQNSGDWLRITMEYGLLPQGAPSNHTCQTFFPSCHISYTRTRP